MITNIVKVFLPAAIVVGLFGCGGGGGGTASAPSTPPTCCKYTSLVVYVYDPLTQTFKTSGGVNTFTPVGKGDPTGLICTEAKALYTCS